jgi:hypothetical protein
MSITDSRERQARKLAEIRPALIDSGLSALDAQAAALGLARSTAHTVVRAQHKNTGLSARIIGRMLDSPALPPRVRATLCEYAAEKAAGLYGATTRTQRRFQSAMLRVVEGEQSCPNGR